MDIEKQNKIYNFIAHLGNYGENGRLLKEFLNNTVLSSTLDTETLFNTKGSEVIENVLGTYNSVTGDKLILDNDESKELFVFLSKSLKNLVTESVDEVDVDSTMNNVKKILEEVFSLSYQQLGNELKIEPHRFKALDNILTDSGFKQEHDDNWVYITEATKTKFFRGECYLLTNGKQVIVVSDADEQTKHVDYYAEKEQGTNFKKETNYVRSKDRVSIDEFNTLIKSEINDKTTVDRLIQHSNSAYQK